jgi:hypothetical protein
MDFVLFFAMWLVPRRLRHGIRALVTRERGKIPPVAMIPDPKQPQPGF